MPSPGQSKIHKMKATWSQSAKVFITSHAPKPGHLNPTLDARPHIPIRPSLTLGKVFQYGRCWSLNFPRCGQLPEEPTGEVRTWRRLLLQVLSGLDATASGLFVV